MVLPLTFLMIAESSFSDSFVLNFLEKLEKLEALWEGIVLEIGIFYKKIIWMLPPLHIWELCIRNKYQKKFMLLMIWQICDEVLRIWNEFKNSIFLKSISDRRFLIQTFLRIILLFQAFN